MYIYNYIAYIYMYLYTYIHVCIRIYVYIHIGLTRCSYLWGWVNPLFLFIRAVTQQCVNTYSPNRRAYSQFRWPRQVDRFRPFHRG